MSTPGEVLQTIKSRSDCINIIIGGRRSGKTSILKELMLEHSKSCRVVVVVPTECNKSAYNISNDNISNQTIWTTNYFARACNTIINNPTVYLFDEFLCYNRFEIAEFLPQIVRNLETVYFAGTPNIKTLHNLSIGNDTTYERNIDAIGTLISSRTAAFYKLQSDYLECEQDIYDSITQQIEKSMQIRSTEHTFEKFQFMMDEQE